jgi:acyl-CoA synthetase (AMP-forming)/AMP-acid ligase II
MILHHSPYGDLEVRNVSITELVLEGLQGRPDDPALIDGPSGRVLTRGALVAGVKALAGGMTARGLAPGKVIAIMAPNLPEYAVVFHGVAWAGGTVTTINPTYTAGEVRHQLTDSGAVLLVTIPQFMETAKAAIEGTGVREIVVLGEAEGATPLSALMGAPLERQAPVDLEAHVVTLPYSSGTTGLPKGVMLTHRNLVANVQQIGRTLQLAPGETTPAFLPFFHIYGMSVLLNFYLAGGGVLVTLPRFDLELFLRVTQDHRCERLFIVPPVAIALAKHPMVGSFDLSSLRHMISGAAPLGAELAAAVSERLKAPLCQGYGMTEMSPVSHITNMGERRDGAAGRTVAGTACRIRDPETGRDLGPGEEGELLVRGPQVMKGYLNNLSANAETLVEDGWLRTGDIAMIDADGWLFIRDRLKELIKVKGFQVAPAEVEATLLAHPKVGDVAVIGVPDDAAGEVPAAFVVPGAGGTPTLEELQAHLASSLARYKVIQRLSIVESIPKSASGKILRRLLKATVPA